MAAEVKRTQIAQAALEASAVLNLRFANRPVGVNPPRRLMVAEPDGPSTDGGKRVRQSIVLSPTMPSPIGQVMVGWLDIAQKKAELRAHELVRAQFEQRFHQPFDVTREAYDKLMRDVQTMLTAQDIAVSVIEQIAPAKEEPRAVAAPPPATEPSRIPWVVGIGVLVAAAVAAMFFVR